MAHPPAASTRTLTVALAGNPNSGKTTIFNALTGLRQKVANYPGVTVEKKTGRCKLDDGTWVNVIDLPGTYSLISRSPDEQVAMEVLRGLREGTPAPDVVVVVVDASNLQRNLYLVSQLIELGRPLVVALNMMDIAQRRGAHVNPGKLAEALRVEVVPIVGHKRKGIDELKHAIRRASVAPLPNWPLPEAMKEELLLVGGGLAILDSAEERVLSADSPAASTQHPTPSTQHLPQPRAWICRSADDIRRLDRYQALAERLLIGDRAADVEPLARHEPVKSLLNSATARLHGLGIDPMQADVEAHYRWIESVATAAASNGLNSGRDFQPMPAEAEHGLEPHATLSYAPAKTLTEKADAILIHRVWGLVIFAMMMALLFVTIFFIADPIMGAFEGAVAWLGELVSSGLADGPLKSLVVDGIFAGVGAVVVFVPQIALLFLFLAIMEDSGYLARAAFLMDKLLGKVGLHGKAFIPLLSSFACAIPGIMATRTIESRKDRLATIFIAPFMSCSARLPVYFLLIGTFFASYSALVQGGIMMGLYLFGILAAVFTAWLFKKTLLKGPAPAFILELPTYKVPQLREVARQVGHNTWAFLAKAGTIIFCLSVILWAMMYYPRLPESRVEQIEASVVNDSELHLKAMLQTRDADTGTFTAPAGPRPTVDPEVEESLAAMAEQVVAGEQLRHSIAGRFGHAIEPLIRPLGYDWKMGVGLVGAFAAREVFVSTMGIVYSVGGDDEETTDLQAAMQADTLPDGRPVWTSLVAISLLVWFVLAMQCMSTLAIVRRETSSWRWPLGMLLYMNALAYICALGVYQIGRIWFA